MAKDSAPTKPRKKAAATTLSTKIIRVRWNHGRPNVDSPVRVPRNQTVEWQIAAGDDASDFEVDFGTNWPLRGPQRKLKPNDPRDIAEVIDTHPYDCWVWPPRARGAARKPMIVTPRIVITDPGGGEVPPGDRTVARKIEKITKQVERVLEDLQNLSTSLAGRSEGALRAAGGPSLLTITISRDKNGRLVLRPDPAEIERGGDVEWITGGNVDTWTVTFDQSPFENDQTIFTPDSPGATLKDEALGLFFYEITTSPPFDTGDGEANAPRIVIIDPESPLEEGKGRERTGGPAKQRQSQKAAKPPRGTTRSKPESKARSSKSSK
jgi:hypothetical protein